MGITVTGEGRAAGTPDLITVHIGVSLERDSVARATADAAGLAAKLVDTLTEHGIAEADVQTAHYSVQPSYDYRNDLRRLAGYRVTNEFRVRIVDLERAGEIIDAVAIAGGNDLTVGGVAFGIDDDRSVVAAARDAAWADARRTAEQLAELAGVALGTPTEIRETVGAPSPIHRLAFAEDAARAATPIESGAVDAVVTIEVTFGLD